MITLPVELQLQIFRFCSEEDLSRISEVCRSLHEVIADPFLWKDALLQRNIVPIRNQEKAQCIAFYRKYCTVVASVLNFKPQTNNIFEAKHQVELFALRQACGLGPRLDNAISKFYCGESQVETEIIALLMAGVVPSPAIAFIKNNTFWGRGSPLSLALQAGISAEGALLLLKYKFPFTISDFQTVIERRTYPESALIALLSAYDGIFYPVWFFEAVKKANIGSQFENLLITKCALSKE